MGKREENSAKRAQQQIEKMRSRALVSGKVDLATLPEPLRIDDGKIVGAGTHDELLENNEIYKEIYISQQKGALAQ